MSSKPMIEAVLKAGLLGENALREMKKFSVAIDPDAKSEEPKDLDTAATIIASAIAEEGYVMVRETDLEILHQYAETARRGVLHLEIDSDVEPSGFTATDLDISFGKTKLGEYLIAWRSESIEDMLINGRSYLQVDDERLFFGRIRELFYGDTKAFIACTVASKEPVLS
jgi:hypothetical protein